MNPFSSRTSTARAESAEPATRTIPPIDEAVPTHLETATFALG